MTKRRSSGRRTKTGGRTQNEWSLVSRGDVKQFMATTGLKKSALARQLGVSAASVTNWLDRGKAPSEPVQAQLRDC